MSSAERQSLPSRRRRVSVASLGCFALGGLVVLLAFRAPGNVSVPEADFQPWEDNGESIVLRGRAANLFAISLLEDAQRRLEACAGYTAMFFRREVIDGALEPPKQSFLRLRHEPYSVYMRRVGSEDGEEVIYVEGQNDGQLIAHLSGWRGAILPILHLDPDDSLAQTESRYPITQSGMHAMAERILLYRRREVDNDAIQVRMTEARLNGRPCYAFEHIYPDRETGPPYRRSIYFIDCDLLLPVYVRNYAWPEEGSDDLEVLIEEYAYTEIDFDAELNDEHFDPANPDYGFE